MSTVAAARMLVSSAQAAEMLGVGLTTFRETIQPKLPHVYIGRRLLFDERDLRQWVDDHKVGPVSFPLDGPSTSSASGTLGIASTSPRAKQILEKLRGRRRASTRT